MSWLEDSAKKVFGGKQRPDTPMPVVGAFIQVGGERRLGCTPEEDIDVITKALERVAATHKCIVLDKVKLMLAPDSFCIILTADCTVSEAQWINNDIKRLLRQEQFTVSD